MPPTSPSIAPHVSTTMFHPISSVTSIATSSRARTTVGCRSGVLDWTNFSMSAAKYLNVPGEQYEQEMVNKYVHVLHQ